VRSALQSSVPSDVNPETFIRSFLNLAKHWRIPLTRNLRFDILHLQNYPQLFPE
jgi:hypothetical protein